MSRSLAESDDIERAEQTLEARLAEIEELDRELEDFGTREN